MVMVPGYNEPPTHFDTLRRGNNGAKGLDAYGIDSITFGECDDTLRERIDRFAVFVDDLKKQGKTFPIVLLGYSLGGLVVRAFLRRYPERVRDVSHVIMISTPNWGVEVFAMPFITKMLRMPDRSFGDMDLRSDFMRWLNGTSGQWKDTQRGRAWVLDSEPWTAPPGTRMLVIQGLIPARGCDNDGLVWGDSATLGSRLPARFIVGPHANHMNVIGHFDPLVMFGKGFLANERVWPLTLRAVTQFIGVQPAAHEEQLTSS
jgi:pimeloyl-ACP methyl ester carboxylesterase